jgi:hypothetical protein
MQLKLPKSYTPLGTHFAVRQVRGGDYSENSRWEFSGYLRVTSDFGDQLTAFRSPSRFGLLSLDLTATHKSVGN